MNWWYFIQIKKDFIIPKASSAPKIGSQPKEQDFSELSPSAVLAPIWKRYHNKASKLLTEIRLNPTIQYNHKGEIQIDGTLYEKSDIRELLSVCFYSKNNKEVVALGPFIAFLKDNSLYQSVINPKLIISDSNYPWFYLGHLMKWNGRHRHLLSNCLNTTPNLYIWPQCMRGRPKTTWRYSSHFTGTIF